MRGTGGALQGDRGRGTRRCGTGGLLPARARRARVAAVACAARRGAVSPHRRALVRARQPAQSELSGLLLRARAFRALPDNGAPACGTVVVLPPAAVAGGAA